MKKIFFYLIMLLSFPFALTAQSNNDEILADKILNDSRLDTVEARALRLLTGFTAGTSYGAVWIRDLNTFINGSMQGKRF